MSKSPIVIDFKNHFVYNLPIKESPVTLFLPPAFLQARDILGGLMTHLPKIGPCSFGPYWFAGNWGTLDRIAISLTEELPKGSPLLVAFFDESTPHMLRSFTGGLPHRYGQLWTIHTNGLKTAKTNRNGKRWEFQWGWDGSLRYMRVDLGDGASFINVYPTPSEAEVDRYGDSKELKQIPDDLIGCDRVFGREIPWTIDIEAKARQILDGSQLREFAQAVLHPQPALA